MVHCLLVLEVEDEIMEAHAGIACLAAVVIPTKVAKCYRVSEEGASCLIFLIFS